MEGRYSTNTVEPPPPPPQIDVVLSVAKGMQKLLMTPKTRLLFSLRPFLLLLAPLVGTVFRSIRETLPNWAQVSIHVLKNSNNPTIQAPEKVTVLISTILPDIKACNNNIYNNNKREGRISSRLGWWFLLILQFFFTFFGFFGYFYTTLCLISCISLNVFGQIPLGEWWDRQSPQPSLYVNFRS